MDFEAQLRSAFPHVPTPGQELFIRAFSRFFVSRQPRCTLLLRGYAGTGKTTSVGAVVRVLAENGTPTVLLAPTGRAAKVMQQYAGVAASTIHRQLYCATRGRDGAVAYGLAPNPWKGAVFLVDEASMIGESNGVRADDDGFAYRSLLDDLMEYVFNGEDCRLVLIGDDAQLPPVGTDRSPALDEEGLRRDFHLTVAGIRLTDVVRQELDSAILANAHGLRLRIDAREQGFPALREGAEVLRLAGGDMQEVLEDLYGRYGEEGVAVITRSNKRANLFNASIRTRILGREEDLDAGDRLMVVRNNYHWLADRPDFVNPLIANGDAVEVLRIVRRFERYGAPFAEAELRLLDAPPHAPFTALLHLSVLHTDAPSLPSAELRALYEAVAEDYVELGDRRRIHKAVLADPCYQALQVKFAWALTCHKAQGGQWPAVVVDQGYLTEEHLNVELHRWMYTAFTRARERLYLLNFVDAFFPGGGAGSSD